MYYICSMKRSLIALLIETVVFLPAVASIMVPFQWWFPSLYILPIYTVILLVRILIINRQLTKLIGKFNKEENSQVKAELHHKIVELSLKMRNIVNKRV